MSHNMTNMIICDQCNKLFGRKDNLLQHKKKKIEMDLEIYVYLQNRNFHKKLILQIESNRIKFVKLYFYDNFFS